MATGKVTADAVKALQAGPRDEFLWDDKLAGFGVKVTPTGGRVYLLQYRVGGRGHKTKRYTIGRDGVWKAGQARLEAERLLGLVDRGTDIGAKAKERARVAVDLAFSPYARTFADTALKTHWPKSWQMAKQCLEIHACKHLGDKPLPAITSADVRGLLKRLDAKPATKRNLYSTLNYLFNRSVKDEVIAASPMAKVEAPPTVEERTRTLSDEELRWLWLAADEEAPAYRGIVRLLMLLGQRRSEVGGLPWAELSRERAEWHLPKARAKNNCETFIPLTASMIATFDAVAGGTKWPRKGLVFPSGAGTAVSGFSKVKRRIDARMTKFATEAGATLGPWVFHDLRRTLATNMQRLRVSYETIEHLLNHKERVRTGIGKVYQTHGFKDEKLAALEKWEARLGQIVSGSSGVVIPFGKRA